MWHKILFCYAIILHGIDAAESNLSTSIGYISNRKPSPLKSSELFSFENFLEFFASHQSNLYNLKSVDVQCIDDLMQIYDELQNESVESLRMIDAWGRFPSGILTGNFYAFGNFHECFDVNIARRGRDERIQPQYCLVEIFVAPDEWDLTNRLRSIDYLCHLGSFNIVPRFTVLFTKSIALYHGICIPASCSPKSFKTILNAMAPEMIPGIDVELDLSPEFCQTEETTTQYTTLDVIVITTFCAIFILTIVSTGYDVVCTIINKKRHKLLLTFSAATNISKIFSCQRHDAAQSIDCLHGIRAIATAWVILAHTYIMYLSFPTQNKTELITWTTEHYYSTFIVAPVLPVETYFVLSAFLVTLSLLKRLEKSNGRLNIFKIYLHRYVRLTPLLVAVAMFEASLMKFCGSGPIWAPYATKLQRVFERKWWKLLLYIRNFDRPDTWVSHAWYLSVDTQLYVFAPLMAYLLYRVEWKVLILPISGICMSIASTFYTYISNGHSMTRNFVDIYFATHTRAMTWLVGVILGFIVFHTRTKTISIPAVLNVVGWIASIATFAAANLAYYSLATVDHNPSAVHQALYNIFSRLLWALAIAYVVFACIHGYGGPVNRFLSLPFWQPLSRLSYAMYLVSVPLMVVSTGSMKHASFFSGLSLLQNFFGYYGLSILLGTIASLAIELPMISLEEYSLRSKTNEGGVLKTRVDLFRAPSQ